MRFRASKRISCAHPTDFSSLTGSLSAWSPGWGHTSLWSHHWPGHSSPCHLSPLKCDTVLIDYVTNMACPTGLQASWRHTPFYLLSILPLSCSKATDTHYGLKKYVWKSAWKHCSITFFNNYSTYQVVKHILSYLLILRLHFILFALVAYFKAINYSLFIFLTDT